MINDSPDAGEREKKAFDMFVPSSAFIKNEEEKKNKQINAEYRLQNIAGWLKSLSYNANGELYGRFYFFFC